MSRMDPSGMFWGACFMALGVVFLLDRLDVWRVSPGLLWPSLLLALGVAILLRGLTRRAQARKQA